MALFLSAVWPCACLCRVCLVLAYMLGHVYECVPCHSSTTLARCCLKLLAVAVCRQYKQDTKTYGTAALGVSIGLSAVWALALTASLFACACSAHCFRFLSCLVSRQSCAETVNVEVAAAVLVPALSVPLAGCCSRSRCCYSCALYVLTRLRIGVLPELRMAFFDMFVPQGLPLLFLMWILTAIYFSVSVVLSDVCIAPELFVLEMAPSDVGPNAMYFLTCDAVRAVVPHCCHTWPCTHR